MNAVAFCPGCAEPPLVMENDVFGSKTELPGLYVRLIASAVGAVEARASDEDEDSSIRCDDAEQCVHGVSVFSESLLEELVFNVVRMLFASSMTPFPSSGFFCFCFVLLLNFPNNPFLTFDVVDVVVVVELLPNLHLFTNILLILSANGQLLNRKLLDGKIASSLLLFVEALLLLD